MQKKVEKKAVEEKVETLVKQVLNPVSPITLDFGREDLNALRDKVNEIVKKIS